MTSRPGNLLLSQTANGETQVLIADLGVAKSMIDAVGATMTAGTPSYMAPEQAMGVTPLDRRADIYSLTAVTYAMLTGQPPFLVRSIADILARDPARAPEPIAERLGAPSTLDGVMISGLAADRNRRPPTALLLADGLETIAGEMQTAGTSRQVANGSVIPHDRRDGTGEGQRDHRVGAAASYSIGSVILPAALSTNVGIRAGQSLSRPGGPPAFQPPPQPLAGSYFSSGDPYALSQLTTPPPEALTPSRPVSYYVLLGVSALALFAISMFLTILVLR